jgi:hypothetical protein
LHRFGTKIFSFTSITHWTEQKYVCYHAGVIPEIEKSSGCKCGSSRGRPAAAAAAAAEVANDQPLKRKRLLRRKKLRICLSIRNRAAKLEEAEASAEAVTDQLGHGAAMQRWRRRWRRRMRVLNLAQESEGQDNTIVQKW